jgi:hypothetical protein
VKETGDGDKKALDAKTVNDFKQTSEEQVI